MAGPRLAVVAAVPVEIVLGRWLAFCCHPLAAWHVLPPVGRCLLAVSYTAGSFVASLTALMLL